MSEPTARPWRVSQLPDRITIVDAADYPVVGTHYEADYSGTAWPDFDAETAALIVAAVNAYPALEDAVNVFETIAKQKLCSEMDKEDLENGDFEGAYDIIIGLARDALSRIRETEAAVAWGVCS